MKAPVLMGDVIEQMCMTRVTIDDLEFGGE